MIEFNVAGLDEKVKLEFGYSSASYGSTVTFMKPYKVFFYAKHSLTGAINQEWVTHNGLTGFTMYSNSGNVPCYWFAIGY